MLEINSVMKARGKCPECKAEDKKRKDRELLWYRFRESEGWDGRQFWDRAIHVGWNADPRPQGE